MAMGIQQRDNQLFICLELVIVSSARFNENTSLDPVR